VGVALIVLNRAAGLLYSEWFPAVALAIAAALAARIRRGARAVQKREREMRALAAQRAD
jgi:hypothetical protein